MTTEKPRICEEEPKYTNLNLNLNGCVSDGSTLATSNDNVVPPSYSDTDRTGTRITMYTLQLHKDGVKSHRSFVC